MSCSETWPMKAEHEARLERAEMRMIRWMCGVSLRNKIFGAELRDRMGVEAVSVVMRRSRRRWYGRVERKNDEDWVKGCTVLEVEGVKPRGRPKRTWLEVIRNDMKAVGGYPRPCVVEERDKGENRPTRVILEKRQLNRK